jgi:NTP pyrophosphatase (non-canonical NTP hydrolase)
MENKFKDILNIARENVRSNQGILALNMHDAAERSIKGLFDEVQEVRAEIKEGNEVYLVDELSDIAWDYANLLAVLEVRGLIPSIEAVLAHGAQKYTERAPAFRIASSELWDEIKQKQKAELKRRHEEKYGT